MREMSQKSEELILILTICLFLYITLICAVCVQMGHNFVVETLNKKNTLSIREKKWQRFACRRLKQSSFRRPWFRRTHGTNEAPAGLGFRAHRHQRDGCARRESTGPSPGESIRGDPMAPGDVRVPFRKVCSPGTTQHDHARQGTMIEGEVTGKKTSPKFKPDHPPPYLCPQEFGQLFLLNPRLDIVGHKFEETSGF